jgi:hypothetical protein
MRLVLALGVLVLAACATAPPPEGLRAPGEPAEMALERLEQECPDYWQQSSPEQRSNLVNRVIAPDYPLLPGRPAGAPSGPERLRRGVVVLRPRARLPPAHAAGGSPDLVEALRDLPALVRELSHPLPGPSAPAMR